MLKGRNVQAGPGALSSVIHLLECRGGRRELEQTGVTTAGHLPAFNLGLKSILVDRRRHRDRETCLFAISQGLTTGGRRTSSSHGHSFSVPWLPRRSMSRRQLALRIVGKLG